MRTRELGEFGVIDRIRRATPDDRDDVIVGIGDDCAVVQPPNGRKLLFTCDCQIQGVHFRSEWCSPRALGARVANVNLSDIAAMGGDPLYALCTLAVPGDTGIEWIDELYAGMNGALSRAGARLVGGNTAALDERILVDLFLCGAAPDKGALTRKGARPGDLLYVTGPLGGAAAGLACLTRRHEGAALCGPDAEAAIARHLGPTARLDAGRTLASLGTVGACIDISDGLVQDAGHIASSSGVGVRIEADLLPIDSAARAVAKSTGADPIPWALYGGEDFELLYSVPRALADDVAGCVSAATSREPHRVGEVVAGEAGVEVVRGGVAKSVSRAGYDHFRRGTGDT